MKSRDEIVIIMLQWLRLYTLESRGSRELKTFLETRLISSRVDQKLKNKEGIHGFLKKKLARRSWPIEAFVGAVFKRDGDGSTWRGRGATLAMILTVFSGRFSPHFHNFSTTIGPRSGFDRGPRSPSIFVGSCRGDSAAEGV